MSSGLTVSPTPKASKPDATHTHQTADVQSAGPLRSTWWTAILPLLLTIFFIQMIPRVAAGEVLSVRYDWIPSMQVPLGFYVDGLALIMALLVSGIGTLIYFYASSYLAGDRQLTRFYVIMTVFMLSMLGLVTAGNILTLFVFWELTSISSYLLIGYKHEKGEARDAALQALLITAGGGLALLAGMVILGQIAGSYELADILASGELIKASPLYTAAALLVIAGAFTKSAQFPFHFWLPGAMAAPTPVSAYLHSATMVKAGVFLLARLFPALGGTDLWSYTLIIFGGFTMLFTAYIAWQETDLKRILAYTTVSALGTLTMLIGMGTPIALKAAIIFLIVHSLYKGALFMVAGAVDHATGTRDITKLGGVGKVLPITAVAAGLAALSMSGLPPFLGFIGKEVIYEATLEHEVWPWVLTGVAVLTKLFTLVAAALVAFKPFWTPAPAVAHHDDGHGHDDHGDHHHGETFLLWLGPVVLGGLSLAGGLLAGPVGNLFIGPGVSGLSGTATSINLYLWHGVNLMLILSIVTIVAGIGVYAVRGTLLPAARRLTNLGWGPSDVIFGGWIEDLKYGSMSFTRRLQNGQLRRYVRIVLMTLALLVGGSLLAQELAIAPPTFGEIDFPEVAIAVLMLTAAVVAARTNSRMAAVTALGVVGFGMALLFVSFGAPDLAMTLFAVETLTVLLLVLVLFRLPRFETLTTRAERYVDVLVAGAAGVVMTVLVLVVTSITRPTPLTDYFAESSYLLAQGRNVVNVILVDFRSLDTFGEIIVLGIAAIGVMALIKLHLDPSESNKTEKESSR